MNELICDNSSIRRVKVNDTYYYCVRDVLRIVYGTFEYENWSKLKKKLEIEGYFTIYDDIKKLPFVEGNLECVERPVVFRIIQSIDTPEAESFKNWFASLAEERIDEINNPDAAIQRIRKRYKDLGYDEQHINVLIKTSDARSNVVSEQRKRGATSSDINQLADIINKETFGMTVEEHKKFKNVENGSLRNNMSTMELLITALGDQTTAELHKRNNSYGIDELSKDAHVGGQTAFNVRKQVEEAIHQPVLTSKNAKDFIDTNEQYSIKERN